MPDEIEIEDDFNEDAWDEVEGPEQVDVPPSTGKLMRQKEILKTAIQMRSAGVSLDDIADELGYASGAAAGEAIARQMKGMVRQATDTHLDMQVARTEQLMMVMWNKAMKGDAGAWDRVLKAMDKMDAYYGIGAGSAGPGVQINVGNGGASEGGGATGVIIIEGTREQRVQGLREMAAGQGFDLPESFGQEPGVVNEAAGTVVDTSAKENEA